MAPISVSTSFRAFDQSKLYLASLGAALPGELSTPYNGKELFGALKILQMPNRHVATEAARAFQGERAVVFFAKPCP